MPKKEILGFICIGHGGKSLFLNKETGEIVSVNTDDEEGGYIIREDIRLKKEFPLPEKIRKKLMSKHNLLTQEI